MNNYEVYESSYKCTIESVSVELQSISTVFNQLSVSVKNTNFICSTPSVSNISHVSSVFIFISILVKHNKFIRSALSVSRPKEYQVYREELSVTRSIRCIKGYRMYQRVS